MILIEVRMDTTTNATDMDSMSTTTKTVTTTATNTTTIATTTTVSLKNAPTLKRYSSKA